MSKIITTIIDGIPVELEILSIAPKSTKSTKSTKSSESSDGVNKRDENLTDDATLGIKENDSLTAQVRVIKVGSDEIKADTATVEKIEEEVKNNPAKFIRGLIESIVTVGPGKVWWRSRTVWVNIAAIIVSIGAYFGLNIHLDPEFCMMLFPVILSVINLILRAMTKKPLDLSTSPKANK